ncbi:hypothetical protein L211DRAFT_637918 [Terfezia boudieri ATCC MYA-4762]|uniref:Uncharacterized protein n=1 Tax=Terfezia boudieri ATCC MYA-4762 TaxID=1051890 RepID=A0A3N4LD13_9PEZI|nr:hypothetical protein L211DRAFT_637918 [Terfezia boudieri ATCC MYA-4762]
MSRSQAHVSLQHQTILSNTMATLPGISELAFGLSAKGGKGPSSPPMHHCGGGGDVHPPAQHLGHVDVVPPAPQSNNTSHSRGKPYYTHVSVTQMPMSPWQAISSKGRSIEQIQYEQEPLRYTVQQQLQLQQHQQQKQQQQHNIPQYRPSTAGRMQQASQLSSSSPVPEKQNPSQMQGQHPAAVETWCYNDHDGPWNPMWPRNRVVGPHNVEESFFNKPSLDSGAPVSPRSLRKETCPVAPRPGNGVYYEHDENARQVPTRLVCIPEHHERSASCPTLHLTNPTPIPSRDIRRSNMHNGNYYNSGSFHEQSVAEAHGSSPQTPKTLQNVIRKNLEDPSMHVNKQRVEVKTSYTNDVVFGWMSSPSRELKSAVPTAWGAITIPTSHAIHYGSQETMLSNKSISDLTSTAAETRKQVPRESSSPYADNYHHNNSNNNHNYPRPEIIGASGGRTNHTGHGDSNVMDDYESDRQPSQIPRASSSTTSSDTTNTRISDSGSVTKRRSISAPKREYRCTKKDGCDAVFSCNSLRK